MKIRILAILAALSLSIGAAAAVPAVSYHAPAQNFYQNNWMGGD